MLPIPHELAIAGVYLPPLLVAAILGVALTVASGRLLDHYRLARHFFYPPLVKLALTVIYTLVIGTLFIGS